MTETFLFFDTETTGFPHKSKSFGDDCQPHVVQLAAMLCEDDGLERASINLIINPGVDIPEVTSDIHGITDDIAARCGVSPDYATTIFAGMADVATTAVAHNTPFDQFLLSVMFHRHGEGWSSPIDPDYIGIADTMQMATPIMKMPPTRKMVAAGFKKYKAPRLSEAYEYFMGEKLEGAHDAMVDVRACRDIYFKMID